MSGPSTVYLDPDKFDPPFMCSNPKRVIAYCKKHRCWPCKKCGTDHKDGKYVTTEQPADQVKRLIRAVVDGKDNTVTTDELIDELAALFRSELAKSRRAPAAGDATERMEDALHQIKQWSLAYPLSVFPEPDFKRVAEVLKAAGITLDAVSASNMRHVITRVQAIVDAALRAEGEGK